jgi:hypothetical protein
VNVASRVTAGTDCTVATGTQFIDERFRHYRAAGIAGAQDKDVLHVDLPEVALRSRCAITFCVFVFVFGGAFIPSFLAQQGAADTEGYLNQ